MPEKSSEALLRQLKISKPQVEEVVTECTASESVKEAFLHFVGWLKTNNVPPSWLDIGEQLAILFSHRRQSLQRLPPSARCCRGR